MRYLHKLVFIKQFLEGKVLLVKDALNSTAVREAAGFPKHGLLCCQQNWSRRHQCYPMQQLLLLAEICAEG